MAKEMIEEIIEDELKNMRKEIMEEETEKVKEEKVEENEEKTNEEENEGETFIIKESSAEELDSVFEEKEKELEEKVEAALFISAKFLTLQELIVLTDINPIMLKEILKRLERKYSRGAIKLVNKNNSWKMDVSERYHYLINRLATGTSEFTKAEQETLAVIAYKQPVKQSVIIKIRGNKGYDHIKKFRDLGMVQAKKVGHTLELQLSEDFYEYFHVNQKNGQIVEDAADEEEEEEEENREDVEENEKDDENKKQDEEANNYIG